LYCIVPSHPTKDACSENYVKQSRNLSFADMAKQGQWLTVGASGRQKSKIKNRFIGKTGIAATDSSCKFRAAEQKVPILITNVHTDTSPSDIIDYIHDKTRVIVNTFAAKNR
jgi:hypothetical protein